jgi:hypothetical protein
MSKVLVICPECGGNRGHWDFVYEECDEGPDCPCPGCKMEYVLPEHPNYVRDYDDDFDSTYAYVVFGVPEKYQEFVKALEDGQLPSPGLCVKFQTLIDELKGEEKNED